MGNTQAPQEIFTPSAEVMAAALVKDHQGVARKAREDLAGFWAERAEGFEWFRKWDTVLDDSKKPFYKWFVGAQVNTAYNCLDRHVPSCLSPCSRARCQMPPGPRKGGILLSTPFPAPVNAMRYFAERMRETASVIVDAISRLSIGLGHSPTIRAASSISAGQAPHAAS
jgi:hypothetical protein